MNNEQFWANFNNYVEDTDDLSDSPFSNMVREITGEDNPLLARINRIISYRVINYSRPLTFALASLEASYESALWNESMKKEIVTDISFIVEHCENPDLRSHLPPQMLSYTYQSVYKYGERLAEFDVAQQEKISNAIVSLRKYIE